MTQQPLAVMISPPLGIRNKLAMRNKLAHMVAAVVETYERVIFFSWHQFRMTLPMLSACGLLVVFNISRTSWRHSLCGDKKSANLEKQGLTYWHMGDPSKSQIQVPRHPRNNVNVIFLLLAFDESISTLFKGLQIPVPPFKRTHVIVES